MKKINSGWTSLSYGQKGYVFYFLLGDDKFSDVLKICDVYEVELLGRSCGQCVVFLDEVIDLKASEEAFKNSRRENCLARPCGGSTFYLPMYDEGKVVLRPCPLDDDPTPFALRHKACSLFINNGSSRRASPVYSPQ